MPETLHTIAREAEADLLWTAGCWFPRCIDDEGGFHQNFDRRWHQVPGSERTLVFQCRMTWVLATLARRRPNMHPDHQLWARRGIRFIEERFTDSAHGGLWFTTSHREEKHSYGIAFAVFAAAACARAGDQHAAELALALFSWWAGRAFDDAHGAFFDALNPDGTPRVTSSRRRDLISIPYGLRSMNTHLHAIEALTELYRATNLDPVRTHLEALVQRLELLVETDDRLYTTYTRTWRPVDRTISFGHDIEAVFLALDARASLGWPDESPLSRLLPRTLRWGIDRRCGGMYYGRRRFWRLTQKVGWVQAEALNTLGYLAARSPTASPHRYIEALSNVWAFIAAHVIDTEHGGWWGRLDRRGRIADERKAHRWKSCYHSVRALLNTSDHIRAEATATSYGTLTTPGEVGVAVAPPTD